MNEILDRFSQKLMPVADQLNRNRYLAAIRDGFFASMSIIIVGSMFLIFPNFPYQGFIDLMNNLFNDSWIYFCNQAYDMTVNIMVIFVIFGISRSLAHYYHRDSVGFVVLSLVAFFILTPLVKEVDTGTFLPFGNFGSSGLFLGIICAIFASEIVQFILKRGWKIKLPESVPSNVAGSFESLIPAVFVIIIFLAINLIFRATPFGTAQNFIFSLLQEPLTALGSSIGATIFVQVLATLLFAFGLHGPNIVGSVMTPIWLTLTIQNADAFKNGEPIPNIVCTQFDANFVKLGGCGATIGLVLLMAFFAKSQQYKALGKLAFAPTIFNINEPVIFGAPVVLNPILMIPFIISPLIFGFLTWLVMKIGLVPYPNGINIPWTMPLGISGLFVSGWRGALWQIVEIFLSIAWYFPFFKIIDKEALETENSLNSSKSQTISD